MIIYRLTTGNYAHNISGQGAKNYGGRWNPVGIGVVYMSEFISLSILEILVRVDKFSSPDTYTLLSIQIPEDSVATIELKKLRQSWQNHIEYTRSIGDEFLKANQTLVLKVPSAIVPQEHNFLINPQHKDFKKIKVIHTELLELDKRLFQTQ
ncbi:MAG TPA: RES family NAD+ phosphorylase [Chitinophagaceae bacterium]